MNLQDEYSEDELKTINIQFLGLTQQPWTFKRGAKLQRHYTDENNNTIVCDEFVYTYSPDLRKIDSYTRGIEWKGEDGVTFLFKDITPVQDKKKLKQLNREIRQGQLDYLEYAAEDLKDLAQTLPEPLKTQYTTIADSINLLFSHYEVEIEHYIQRGTMEFENAINNETNPSILAILALPARQPDVLYPYGLTVKQSVIHQLNGEVPEG